MKRKSLFFIAILLFSGFLCKSAFASEPEILFSWKSQNFVPDWYEGKSFPINNSKIDVSFEAISQNKEDFGKLMDLSGKNIKWYVNNNLITQGKGLKTASILKDSFPRDDLNVKITFEIFDSDRGSAYFINKYFSIPIISPEIVINNNKFDLNYSVNETVYLSAIPFFFNIPDYILSLIWMANENVISMDYNNPFNLDLKMGSQVPYQTVKMRVQAKNVENIIESASGYLFLKVK